MPKILYVMVTAILAPNAWGKPVEPTDIFRKNKCQMSSPRYEMGLSDSSSVSHLLTSFSIHTLKGVTKEGDIQTGPCPVAKKVAWLVPKSS